MGSQGGFLEAEREELRRAQAFYVGAFSQAQKMRQEVLWAQEDHKGLRDRRGVSDEEETRYRATSTLLVHLVQTATADVVKFKKRQEEAAIALDTLGRCLKSGEAYSREGIDRARIREHMNGVEAAHSRLETYQRELAMLLSKLPARERGYTTTSSTPRAGMGTPARTIEVVERHVGSPRTPRRGGGADAKREVLQRTPCTPRTPRSEQRSSRASASLDSDDFSVEEWMASPQTRHASSPRHLLGPASAPVPPAPSPPGTSSSSSSTPRTPTPTSWFDLDAPTHAAFGAGAEPGALRDLLPEREDAGGRRGWWEHVTAGFFSGTCAGEPLPCCDSALKGRRGGGGAPSKDVRRELQWTTRSAPSRFGQSGTYPKPPSLLGRHPVETASVGITFDPVKRARKEGPDSWGLYVVAVRKGGPADDASQPIYVGDVLLAVDDVDVRRMTPDQTADLVRGLPGSVVSMFLRGEDGAGRSVRLVRAEFDDLEEVAEYLYPAKSVTGVGRDFHKRVTAPLLAL